MSNNTAVERLLDILAWSRPHDSQIEKRFCKEYLDTIPGMERDGIGNRYLRIAKPDGQPSIVAWSCHVDTVASKGGRQAVHIDEFGFAALSDPKPGRSLGADDGVGVWLLMEMIEARVPGLYLFHRGEEQGCIGSRWLARNTPELLNGIKMAIAFDRKGTEDIITHQVNGRTASDAFANSFAAAVALYGLKMKPDDTGIYTDTNEYAHLVDECSNISCGYYSNHGPRERVDVDFCVKLRAAVLALDAERLTVEREAGVFYDFEPRTYGSPDPDTRDLEEMANIVQLRPYLAACLLADLGIDLQTLDDFIFGDAWPERPEHLESEAVPFDDFEPLPSLYN